MGTTAASPSRVMVKPAAEWDAVIARAAAAVPEAFGRTGRPLNLVQGIWCEPGRPVPFASPVDGRPLSHRPMLDPDSARRAVRAAAAESRLWRQVDLDGRRERVAECLDDLASLRDVLAVLTVWETGTPHRRCLEDLDRLVAGGRWYVDRIEGMLDGRHALGLVSNLSSPRVPPAHLTLDLLVQLLAGNAVIAKAPTGGGLVALTVAAAIARRCGLPVSLLSGEGERLADALVSDPAVDGVVYSGGPAGGREVAAAANARGVRHAIEAGGVNAHGIWSFSDWSRLRRRLRGEFARAKQDPVAHTRFVVERRLLADFLDAYDGAVADLRVGHPLLVVDPDDEPPDIDFGPLVSAGAADRLRERQRRAVAAGAVTLRAGTLDPARFLPGQDVSAYVAPVALLGVPLHCDLHHGAPAGPLDTIVVVDRLWALISQMNASQGSLAASISSDDAPLAAQVAGEVRAFSVGINRTRSWDDVSEHRGGLGASWSGAFAGGAASVRAVTTGRADARSPGNHLHGVVMPGDHRRVLGAAGGG